MTARRKIILDCDPGQDDAVALLLAFAAPDVFDVRAVTTVGGNVPLERTTANARRICELAGRADVLLAAGCPRPMLHVLRTAAKIHGEDGMAGAGLPPPVMPVADAHAVDVIVATARAVDGLTLAVTGPMTNVAVALVKAPDIAARIARIVFMGGAIGAGNASSSAEYNIWVDPHAAAIVLAAGVPATMIGLDVTHQVLATPGRTAAIAALGTPVARSVAGMLEFGLVRTRGAGAAMHDPCVLAWLMRPDLFAGRPAHVVVETASPITLGRTAVDWLAPAPNALVLESVRADDFFALLTERLRRL